MAYQGPLPPRACSKAWAHRLWVYDGTQFTNVTLKFTANDMATSATD
jgi:hypothetical protein